MPASSPMLVARQAQFFLCAPNVWPILKPRKSPTYRSPAMGNSSMRRLLAYAPATRAIILALNAATDVWDRLIAASSRHTALIAAMEMQFANRVLLHEFEVEDATQKFSAELRRHMKRERKIFDECHAMVGTPKS